MADKAISELVAAPSVTPDSLFVLQQDNTAKKLTAQVLENWLVSFADGHGGIQSIVKKSTSGLVDTYRITLSDTTTFDFQVTNGKGINSISKTGTSGLVDTYKIQYNNNTSSTFTVTNGAKGDKGDNQYIWIKYASQEPTASSHSFGDVPDNWIGIYSGAAATAPTDWAQYKWFQIKGDKGDTGAAAKLISSAVEYQVSSSGTTVPSGTWLTSVPTVAQGEYLWTRITNTFNTGSSVISYSVARMGMDGLGSVSSVAGVSPDASGNVALTAANVGAASKTIYRCGTATGDLNDVLAPGWYWVATANCTNTPLGDNFNGAFGFLEVITSSNSDQNVLQRFTQYKTGKTWVRDSVNEWKDWIRTDSIDTYPVGSIYLSANNTSPASLFGGTWTQLKDRFLLGAGGTYTAGNTGGAATHKLTVNEMPSHNHSFSRAGEASGSSWIGGAGTATIVSETTGNAGGGAAHNNMPPYLVVYMWKRTA